MDWIAAKSYYLGYKVVERPRAIVFFYSYFVTLSIGMFFSVIPPLLFIFSPSSLHTTRSSHFLIITLVCLSNMFCLYYQAYMISDSGEPQLSSDTCRFVIYISTFAKPIGLYLTLLFSIERLSSKILSKFFIRAVHYRQLLQRIFSLLIILGTLLICSLRLDQVLHLIPRNPSGIRSLFSSDSVDESRADIEDTSSNSTDRTVVFDYCFRSMNIDKYASLLSFYVAQYIYEYIELGFIFLISTIIIVHQCCLPRLQQQQQQRSPTRFSVHTKFYLCLSWCILISECLLIFLHLIVDDRFNNYTYTQFISLQSMLFTYNFRCIFLPLIICITVCDPFKQWLYELFISRPYLDSIDENDATDPVAHRTQRKFRRPFTKKNNREPFDDDELQVDS